MRKLFLVVILLYVFALLQMSFFTHLFPAGFIPNLVVAGVLALAIFEKPESYASFTAAIFGGFLMDVFSGGIIGVWPTVLLVVSFILKRVLEYYVRFPIPQKF